MTEEQKIQIEAEANTLYPEKKEHWQRRAHITAATHYTTLLEAPNPASPYYVQKIWTRKRIMR